MNKMLFMSIKFQLFVMVFIMTLFTTGIIIYSGISSRNDKIREALSNSSTLTSVVANEHEKMVADIRQLSFTLAQLSEIEHHNAAGMQKILKEVLMANPKYSNIFIADRTGGVLASAVPFRDTNVSDRSYFKKALASGRFSSGEYTISRFTNKSVLPFAYPFKDRQGEIHGVIVMGLDMTYYSSLLDTMQLPYRSGYLLLDHKGIIISKGSSPRDFVGEKYNPAAFKRMTAGPDKDTFLAVAHDGVKRFISYRKVRLEGEPAPYLYIRSGIPVAEALSAANKTLIKNLILLISSLCFVVLLISLIAKYSIIDRIGLLEIASKRLADGDVHVKVSSLVAGGELGRLGETFDHMASQIALREEARRESERRYYTIFEQSPDGILLIDPNGKIIEFNDIAHRQLGYSREEFAELSFSDIDPVESPEEIRTKIGKILEAGAAEFFVKHSTKQGNVRDVHIIMKVIALSGSPILHVICHDITERKKAEDELKNHREHLEELVARRTEEISVLHDQLLHSQKLEAVGILAGGIAHEFRNMLTTMKGAAYLIQKNLSKDSPLVRYADQIVSSITKANNLSNGLLSFSRKQTISLKPINFNETAGKIFKLLSTLIREDIEFTSLLTDRDVTVMADANQIEQVLVNLTTNARDAMPDGGKLMIKTDVMEMDKEFINRHGFGIAGSYVVLAVSDTGVGMPEDVITKIFQPFFTTKTVGEGSGLGLAVTYGIIKQHKGFIDVESCQGQGTTFNIYLPVVDVKVAGEKSMDILPVMPGKETILLAEDDTDALEIMSDLLRMTGYNVLVAADGEEAVRLFEAGKDEIQLVIADVRMPKKNGRVVYEEIHGIAPAIKFIFMSGYTEDIIDGNGIKNGYIEFISKSVRPEELLARIREVLDA